MCNRCNAWTTDETVFVWKTSSCVPVTSKLVQFILSMAGSCLVVTLVQRTSTNVNGRRPIRYKKRTVWCSLQKKCKLHSYCTVLSAYPLVRWCPYSILQKKGFCRIERTLSDIYVRWTYSPKLKKTYTNRHKRIEKAVGLDIR